MIGEVLLAFPFAGEGLGGDGALAQARNEASFSRNQR
jgi:hypothetical protein